MNIFGRGLWEQPFLDLWSIPHFMMGVTVAFFFLYYLNNGIYQGLVVVFLIAFVWEIVEHHVGIGEVFTNRTVDVALPLLSFIGVYNLHRIFEFGNKTLLWAFSISAAIFVVTNILGWIAFIRYRA